MEIIYPWMPKELNPNSRPHRMEYARAFKLYKTACWAMTKKANLPKPKDNNVHLEITFVCPDRRRRDWDNLVTAFKAGADGIRDAIGVDDYYFSRSINISPDIGGFVRIRFTYDSE